MHYLYCERLEKAMSYLMSGRWWTSYGILDDNQPVYSALILTEFLMPDIKYAPAHEFLKTSLFDIFSFSFISAE